ncbi:MAG: YdcF family protein [Clostridia bacterium]|nr:YdcF family protein [Clostridia bacterium]
MATTRKRLRSLFLFVLIMGLIALSVALIINICMLSATKGKIVTTDTAAGFDADCILILGAGVRDDGSPSHMLEDRLKTGLELYKIGASDKILMTGDHGRKEYNEVGAMKAYAIDAGVPSENVFMDHAGFSTYESLYRARDVFKAKHVVIVTQGYHLPRALYIANQLGLEAVGVSADLRPYRGQLMRDLREVAARTKDFAKCIFMPEPTFLGEVIPVSGNGNLTNG